MGKRITFISFVVVIIFGFFIWLYEFPSRVQFELPAVQFNAGNSKTVKKTIIRVNGTYHRPLFRKERFEGSIQIDSFPFTKSYELVPLTMHTDKTGVNYTVLTYINPDPSAHHIDIVGTMWVSEEWKEIKIEILREGESNNPKGAYIIAPSTSYEEAQVIMKMSDSSNL
ncbi:hypothetical protein [Paenibacillus assamensis]|uniref:hypothetical protein n=1 Tax=Paenibacillus assamensis TaxID=311244 RepID=UPI00048EBB19|nr:hypothetical protein [Paenibacillus assamensis]